MSNHNRLGNIYEKKNDGNWGYIFGDDGKYYYYSAKDLSNCNKFQIDEGDQVEFRVTRKQEGAKYDRAVEIRRTSVSEKNSKDKVVNPGINPNILLDWFNDEERDIIEKLSEVFYVTNCGSNIVLGTRFYKYCLIKPTAFFSKLFYLKKEFPVVFSDYIEFEPRALDVASEVYKKIKSSIRIDRCCQVFICNDSSIEKKLADELKDRNLNSVVIPFSYNEMKTAEDIKGLVEKRFKKYLFEVDLFSENNPIKDDVFFFGRRDYTHDIATKCKNNAYCGVFGLRRSGKTSLLYAVKRMLETEGYYVTYLPCNAAISSLEWNMALYQIVKGINENYSSRKKTHLRKDYKENKIAQALFEEDLNSLLGGLSKPVILMFDEIEYITFNSAVARETWKSGEGYISFWNAIRGYGLKYPKRISIVIAGTNPMINEVPSIEINGTNSTNPMYGQLSQSNQGAYIPAFDIQGTTSMINTLGGYMGIQFSDDVCARMTIDCGGHPFLIRLLCGCVNKYLRDNKKQRPLTVSISSYEKARTIFEKSSDAQGFYQMILLILQQNYQKEYNVLKHLAIDNTDIISETQDQNSLIHLIGYGLIDYGQGNYAVRFETVRRFMRGEYRFEAKGLNAEQKREEISLRINGAEGITRKIIKQNLFLLHGINEAHSIVIDAMRKNRAANKFVSQAEKLKYEELFDPTINEGLYFSLLKDIICENLSDFSNVFGEYSRDEIKEHFEVLNKSRKASAHGYDEGSMHWTEEDFDSFRESMSWLEDRISIFD